MKARKVSSLCWAVFSQPSSLPFSAILCACLLLGVSSVRAHSDTTHIMYVASVEGCRSACDASMTNVQRILGMIFEKQGIEGTIVSTITLPNARKHDARFLAEKLGISLRDSLPETMRIMTKGVSVPAAIVMAPNGTALVLDALTGRDIDELTNLIERHVTNVMGTPPDSMFSAQRLSCLDTFTIAPTLQSLNDSLMLAYDRLRERMMIVDWRQDRIIHTSQIPLSVRNQYKTSEVAAEWEALERAGVEMTSLHGGYVPDLDNQRVVLCISQMSLEPDTTTTHDASQTQQGTTLEGRVARWEDHIQPIPGRNRADTAYETIIGLRMNAPQRLDDVSVFGCGYAYTTTNPDSLFVAGYADATGEHPLITGLMLAGGDSSFNFEYHRTITNVSAIINRKLLISSYANNVFGMFDTTEKRFTPLRAVGSLALVCSAATAAPSLRFGFGSPYFLVDRDRRLFYAITPRWEFPYPDTTPYALALHAYSVDSGKLEYIKWYSAPARTPRAGLQPFHIQDDMLHVFCQDDDYATVLKIPL